MVTTLSNIPCLSSSCLDYQSFPRPVTCLCSSSSLERSKSIAVDVIYRMYCFIVWHNDEFRPINDCWEGSVSLTINSLTSVGDAYVGSLPVGWDFGSLIEVMFSTTVWYLAYLDLLIIWIKVISKPINTHFHWLISWVLWFRRRQKTTSLHCTWTQPRKKWTLSQSPCAAISTDQPIT